MASTSLIKKSKKQYVALTLYKETKRILNMLGREDWNSNYTELALYRLMKKYDTIQ